MTGLLKDLASKSVLYETPNIKRAITYLKDDTLTLRTDGINIGVSKNKTKWNKYILLCVAGNIQVQQAFGRAQAVLQRHP